jgi:hypothetical protein
MSLVYCLDTNAVLDMCYRYYPRECFDSLWRQLESAVIAGQVSFIQSEDISKEIDRKIVQFEYSETNYTELISYLNIEVIKYNDYAEALNNLKGNLIAEVPFIGLKQSPTGFLEGLTEDLSNISLACIKNAKVITSEQGFNLDITSSTLSKKTPLKIPDVCTYQKVPCGNWLEVFNYLGVRF